MTAVRHHLLPLRLRLCAGMLALEVLCAGLLAASPRLHSHIHDDCAAADHVCAATLFAHGVDPLAPAPLLVAPAIAPLVGALRPAIDVVDASAALRLPPTCGPPRA